MSWLLNAILILAPVVMPLDTPLTISGISCSMRVVVPKSPGFRLFSIGSKSVIFKSIPASQPSIKTPSCSEWEPP